MYYLLHLIQYYLQKGIGTSFSIEIYEHRPCTVHVPQSVHARAVTEMTGPSTVFLPGPPEPDDAAQAAFDML